jgi:hypothetical protein
MFRGVVQSQAGLCRLDCIINGGARLSADTPDAAIVAIPGTPNSTALGLFDVNRIPDALF